MAISVTAPLISVNSLPPATTVEPGDAVIIVQSGSSTATHLGSISQIAACVGAILAGPVQVDVAVVTDAGLY